IIGTTTLQGGQPNSKNISISTTRVNSSDTCFSLYFSESKLSSSVVFGVRLGIEKFFFNDEEKTDE
ncbi:unnamed protein product, partial [marine sediment metagenome]